MKSYQRRKESAYPYYKLATWDTRSLTWRDGKTAFTTAEDATDSLVGGKGEVTPGRYRISEVTESGRRDLEPFEVI